MDFSTYKDGTGADGVCVPGGTAPPLGHAGTALIQGLSSLRLQVT